MKKTYLLDTNVLLTSADSIFSYKNNDIIIPLKVIEEIDKHKKRQDGVGANARITIRILDKLREDGNLYKGVKISEGKGILSIRGYDAFDLPDDFDVSSADNQIIGTAITEKKSLGKEKLIVVTRDINMRVKCDALQIPTEDFLTEKTVNNTEELYTGFIKHLVDDQTIDRYYSDEEIFLEKEDIVLHSHQFVMLVSNQNEKKTALAKFINYNLPLSPVVEYNKIWGLKPRNKEQMFGLNILMDPNIPIITMTGKAGCGKTLLAIAAGLEQIMEENKRYKKLVVSRPVQPVGKDIGFLPGTLEEKMSPWLMPIQDNLEFLLGDNKETIELLYENGTIEVEALTYIRGRSISNAFIIIDEAQNLSIHELKTIITRVGENTKIILTGDIEQIDNVYLDSLSNGLSYAIEKFKEHELAGHISLMKGERSKVATLAAKIL
jgi:PhoH-like ATPase|tara:strand:- start:2381 stop:3688 length:1308 start_codon:yes stop_codon:yes gene_type:complete